MKLIISCEINLQLRLYIKGGLVYQLYQYFGYTIHIVDSFILVKQYFKWYMFA